MLLKQKVRLIFREVIDRASPTRDEQTDVNTKNPASVCILPLHYIYTVNARYAEPAFGRLTTRATNSSRSESAEGWLSVASIYGIGCQQCHCQWKYILRPRKRCPHFRQHFCLFVSYLARSITSREMSITFCFKSTFRRQIVTCFKYFLVK